MKREKFGILSIILDKTIFGFLIVLVSLTLNFAFSQNSFAEYKLNFRLPLVNLLSQ